MRGVSFDKALGRWKARYPGQKERTFLDEGAAIACRRAWEAEHGVPRVGGQYGNAGGGNHGGGGQVRADAGVRPGQYGGWIATGPGRLKRQFATEAEARTQRAAWLEEFAQTGSVIAAPRRRGRPAKSAST